MRAMNRLTSQVPAGLATFVGYGLTAIGTAATAWAASSAHPSVSAGVLAVLTFAAGLATNFGRQIQAKGLPAAVRAAEAEVPAALQALAAEAQKNVALVQAQPDGVDGPHVAYSGAPVPPAA